MEIIRDYSQELEDVEQKRQERIVLRAMAAGLITQMHGATLLQEIWGGH